MITIEPLTLKTQQATTELIQHIFHYENPEILHRSLEMSLHVDKYKETLRELGATLDRHHWIALKENKIVGTIGYYVRLEDEQEASWLSWYCVSPEARGQGIGLRLLDTVIAHIKASGKRYVRVFTADVPEEKRAQKIYAEKGFVPFREPELDPASKIYHLFYLQLEL